MYGVSREDPECIHTVDEAVEYINKVGFLPLFKNEIPGFSLEERTAPEYWWSGDPKSDPWEWREIIARSGKVAYGKFFDKKSIAAHLVGFVYSTISTVAPMFVVIGNIMLMSYVLGYDTLSYARSRPFLGNDICYIFIFSLLTAAPFNAVLSRYMSDVIYEERYDNILSCYYLGLILNIVLSCLFGIPFCIWEYVIGHVHLLFVFTGFCGYISLVLVFYSMLYLSICKDYQKISFYFLLGMVFAFLLSLFPCVGMQTRHCLQHAAGTQLRILSDGGT